MSRELFFMPATEMASRIRRRVLSPVEVVAAFLDRIDVHNPPINAFILVLHDEAIRVAQEAEDAVMRGDPLGPLHGVPIAIKDLFDFKAGFRNTFGCKPLADYVPEVTATYIERLESAGAVVLGKTNTPEMGHKGVTDNMLFGPTSTPFKLGKNAGGSSGGSAAAVAAGLAPIAQGSDGGGSVRIPASFSGVYGFKASYGRVAQTIRPDGFISHTPFIHAGPLARTVEDAALMLGPMTGEHPRDPFSLPSDGTDFIAATRRPIDGLRVAYSPRFEVFQVDPRVAAVVDGAVRAFTEAGAHVEEVKVPLTVSQQELSALWIREIGVLTLSVFETLKKGGVDILRDHRDDVPAEWIAGVEAAKSLSALDYKLDDAIRTEVFDAVQDVFEDFDVLVTPTLGVPPVDNATNGNTLGPSEINGEAVDPHIGWCLTHPINFTGHPAASIPAGFTDDRLPIGMQIIGRRFADDTVFAASAAFERVRPWHDSYLRLEDERTSR